MDFSEYTLISFGDSFTFGQDTVPPYVFTKEMEQSHESDVTQKQLKWKKECNEHSYTAVLAASMGFKNSLNFGIPAGSNERSLMLLETFLRTNPTLKIFVLFNFTSSSRYLNILKLDHEPMYDIVEFSPTAYEWIPSGRYTGIDKKSISLHYTYFRNNMSEMYNHIKDRRSLYYMLSAHNVPHVSFDVLNTMDYLMLRDNPIQYIHDNDGFGVDGMYSNDEYTLTKMDYFNSYYNEIDSDSTILSHIGIDNLDGARNICEYIHRLGVSQKNDNYYYYADPMGHWNQKGHIKVAKLIENYINKKS